MKEHNRALQDAGLNRAERRAVMNGEASAAELGGVSKTGRSVMVNGVDVRNLRRACFVAGTPVETRDGLRAIDRLAIGDQVLSRHEETGEIAYRTVVRTIVIEDKQIYRLVVADDAGNRETIRTTDEHPFWIADHGWVRAADLREGDPLLTPSGEHRVVVSLVEEDVLETVYNIEVDEFHTYFVGELRVFVHNADCGEVEVVSHGAKQGQTITSRTNLAEGTASAGAVQQVTRVAIRDFEEYRKISGGPLKPNTIYEYKGAEFETDSLGRSFSTRGYVDTSVPGQRLPSVDHAIGNHADALPTDVGFHRGADSLGFPGGHLNGYLEKLPQPWHDVSASNLTTLP
ncbi:polymorphic toxin-type HINT domain-containing protein [Pseudoduganella sp. S-14]|uniref:polymorphic toxin-type HINT domain-containing protein n=1 Tax=Pseudoduganella sp. S-14 TaxID=3404065 RepID=UPI003CE8DAEE